MNQIQTSKGILKYRNPTIIENMHLLKEAKEYFKNEDPIGAKISIMERIGPLLDFSEMDGIKSFEELNNHGDEMTLPISDIADYILNKLVVAFSKKA
jgi:hypothetical protein